jgi:hypothetical protein
MKYRYIIKNATNAEWWDGKVIITIDPIAQDCEMRADNAFWNEEGILAFNKDGGRIMCRSGAYVGEHGDGCDKCPVIEEIYGE